MKKENIKEQLHRFNFVDYLDNEINYNSEDDEEYEPSHDTDKYKEWELQERFKKELVDISKKLK